MINVKNVMTGAVCVLFLLPDVSNSALLGDFNNDGVVTISEVRTCINSFIGISTNNVFTAAMFSGKSFTVDGGLNTFNADGTFSVSGVTGIGTWNVNSSGQLVRTGSSKGDATSTILSGSATEGWTVNTIYANGFAANMAIAPVTNIFTATMFSGKRFTVDGTVNSFNADGTFTVAGSNGTGTWYINPLGQLVRTGSSKGNATSTILSGNATQGWTVNTIYTNGTAANMTIAPA